MSECLKKVALVYDWPGRKTCELDIVKRVRGLLEKKGVSALYVSPLGEMLDDDCCYIGEMADVSDVDFSLHFHYSSPAALGSFSYMANWNPLTFFLRHPITGEPYDDETVRYYADCLRSYDVLLSAGCREMDCFAESMNHFRVCNMDLNGGLFLPSSLIHDHLDFPDLATPSVFYISANWERQLSKDRHGSLLDLMDGSGRFSFFGVRESHGKFLWEGIRNYKGELPFDGGESIIKESNRCGISLVLHSPAHHDGGVVSSRIFQAAAAKTVIVADDNPWVLEHFGDSVLTYAHDFSDDAANFEKIMAHVKWIDDHPDESLEKARRANRIFEEKFSLNAAVEMLLNSHEKRMASWNEASAKIAVFYAYSKETISSLIADLKSQRGVQVVVYAYVGSEEDESLVSEQLQKAGLLVSVCRMSSDVFRNQGACLDHFLSQERDGVSGFTFYSGLFGWTGDHLFRLNSMSRKSDGVCVQSAVKLPDPGWIYSEKDFAFSGNVLMDRGARDLTYTDFYNFDPVAYPADSFLFSADYIPSPGKRGFLSLLQEGAYAGLLWLVALEKEQLPARTPAFSLSPRGVKNAGFPLADFPIISASLSGHQKFSRLVGRQPERFVPRRKSFVLRVISKQGKIYQLARKAKRFCVRCLTQLKRIVS